ncbi:MAG: hypothetical protein MUE34_14125 [Acidimicrobiales bacterium]|nr:hypothetical protein [Acidimicrobiales bacterium]
MRGANHAINRLDPHVSIELITGSTARGRRTEILDDLRDRTLDVVAAPRVLDEGIDVPDANLGIVLGASRTRRQMIQRMGRILRRKRPGVGARFVIVFAKDTVEDPATRVERDGFLEEIERIAEATAVFGPGDLDALEAFLAHPGPAVVPEPERVSPEAQAARLAAVEVPAVEAAAAPYLEVDEVSLPQVTAPKAQPKRLSTGDAPLEIASEGAGWFIRCVGCGAASAPVRFRWQVLDETVDCRCD